MPYRNLLKSGNIFEESIQRIWTTVRKKGEQYEFWLDLQVDVFCKFFSENFEIFLFS